MGYIYQPGENVLFDLDGSDEADFVLQDVSLNDELVASNFDFFNPT